MVGMEKRKDKNVSLSTVIENREVELRSTVENRREGVVEIHFRLYRRIPLPSTFL